MTPESGVVLLMFVTLIIAITMYMRKQDEVDILEAKVDDLYSDIQLIEIREMNLKQQLKDVMIENDFSHTV